MEAGTDLPEPSAGGPGACRCTSSAAGAPAWDGGGVDGLVSGGGVVVGVAEPAKPWRAWVKRGLLIVVLLWPLVDSSAWVVPGSAVAAAASWGP
jgi:hypothetical protein